MTLLITDAHDSELKVAQTLLARLRRKRIHAKSLGPTRAITPKGSWPIFGRGRSRPHIARIEGRITPGLDARTTRHESYRVSQRTRKRIEEIFGWLKTVGGMRKNRVIGVARTQLQAYLVCQCLQPAADGTARARVAVMNRQRGSK